MAGALTASTAAQNRSSIGQELGQRVGDTFDIKAYGAVGDGTTLDSPAINRAIEAAVNNFFLLRSRALLTGDASQLGQATTAQELVDLRKQLHDLKSDGEHMQVHIHS